MWAGQGQSLVLKGTRHLPNLESPLGHKEGQRQGEGTGFGGWVACWEKAESWYGRLGVWVLKDAGVAGPRPRKIPGPTRGLFPECSPAWQRLGQPGAGHIALICEGCLPRTGVRERRTVTVPLGVGGEDRDPRFSERNPLPWVLFKPWVYES